MRFIYIIFHTLYIVAPLCSVFLKHVDFYKAHRSEREYLKRETEMSRPSPYCDAVSRRDDTKTMKPIINEAFVASSGDIFRCCIASRRVNITLSAFVIGETTNNKHYSTLLKTHV